MNEALQRKETHPQIDIEATNLFVWLYRCYQKALLLMEDAASGTEQPPQ